MSTITEQLQWQQASSAMPDADITVLCWIVYDDGTTDWCPGWWDGAEWRDACNGGQIAGAVTHWSEPGGPAHE